MKPILFSTPMVQAILEGQKTMTRRVIDKDISNRFDIEVDGKPFAYIDQATGDSYKPEQVASYQSGNVLYVRETFCLGNVVCGENPDGSGAWYIEPSDDGGIIPKQWAISQNVGIDDVKWKPSIFMPKAFSRIFLRVTEVRAERLQNITEEDARAEGVREMHYLGVDQTARAAFHDLWNKLNAARGYGWDKNPWVWVYTFERITREEAMEDKP